MRISDWSSDVCSSDLTTTSTPPTPSSTAHSSHTCRPSTCCSTSARKAWSESGRVTWKGCPQHHENSDYPGARRQQAHQGQEHRRLLRSEEHTSELQSLMRISYAVFCMKKKNKNKT